MLLSKWDAIDFSYIFSWFPLTVRETLVNKLLGCEMFCKQASIGGKRVKNAEQTLAFVKYGLPREEELCRRYRPIVNSDY